MCRHETQNVKFARRKFDFAAPHGDDSAHEIDAEIASMEQGLFAFLLQAMPLRHADARQEFIYTKRFRDIIVGPKIECCNLGAFVVTTRKDDDRQGFAAVPDLTHDIEAIYVGQAKVEDDEIGGFLANHVERGARVGGGRDDVALAFQARVQETKDSRLVIDDENTEWTRTWRHDMASAGSLGVTGTGSLMVKTAPDRSIRLAAVMKPPMASTKPRQIARPSPVPARCLSERLN